MKRRDLIKRHEAVGFKFKRNGGDHDIYGRGDDSEQTPRHKEIKENTAKSILKR